MQSARLHFQRAIFRQLMVAMTNENKGYCISIFSSSLLGVHFVFLLPAQI